MNDNLLKSLQNVKWKVAFKTFGSNHSTLIGLLVDWWISTDSHGSRFVLDEGCTFRYHRKGKGSTRCDAVLLEGDSAKGIVKGIVEVEGSRHGETIKKMGKFFQARSEWKTLKFGIFLAYPTYAAGQKEKRHFDFYPCEKKLFELGKKISAKSPEKKLVILILEKKYERIESGLRSKNDYYKGTPIKVYGKLFLNGKEIATRTLKEQ